MESVSLTLCSVEGGEELLLAGTNFLPTSRVLFTERGSGNTVVRQCVFGCVCGVSLCVYMFICVCVCMVNVCAKDVFFYCIKSIFQTLTLTVTPTGSRWKASVGRGGSCRS